VRPGTRRLAAAGWMAPGVKVAVEPVKPSALVRSNSSTSAGVRHGATSRAGGAALGSIGPGGRSIHGSRPWRTKPNGPRSSVPPASRTARPPASGSTAWASRAAGTPARSDSAPRNTGELGWVRRATSPSSTQPIPRAASPSRCQSDSP
jgi:hypothetical protein